MFGQLVIGPPGSGKSTYCHGMFQFLSAIGRKLAIINLDPANDRLPYPVELDIRDYITLEEIMEELNLGPNGSLLYAFENFDHLIDQFVARVQTLVEDGNYLIIDCPGQVELFTHDNSLNLLMKKLVKLHDLRLCCVSLVDSIFLVSPSQYISILLLTLRSMLQLNLPQVNVFSKIDKLKRDYGGSSLPFKLDYYTEVQDLKYLNPELQRELGKSLLNQKFIKLSETIGEIVEDFNLINFEVLSVENKHSMIRLLSVIDKANGYSFGNELGGDTIWNEAVRASGPIPEFDIHERWIESKEDFDQQERKDEEEIKKLVEGKELTEDELWEIEARQWSIRK